MAPQQNNDTQNLDYRELRQIIKDAIEPIQEQLTQIHDELRHDFYRKDAVDPQLDAIRKDIEALKREQETQKTGTDELRTQVLSTPYKALLILSAILGGIATFISVAQSLLR